MVTFNIFVYHFLDNAGVVIAVVVVVVVLILVGCITMDILFCYCCKRKAHHQNNGMYGYSCIRTYIHIICKLCTCTVHVHTFVQQN